MERCLRGLGWAGLLLLVRCKENTLPAMKFNCSENTGPASREGLGAVFAPPPTGAFLGEMLSWPEGNLRPRISHSSPHFGGESKARKTKTGILNRI